jgi:methyl-accepting chemotaxis protein
MEYMPRETVNLKCLVGGGAIFLAFISLCSVARAEEQKNGTTAAFQEAGDFKGHFVVTADDLTAEDKEMLALVQEAADRAGKLLEKAVNDGVKSEDEIFSALYFPISSETYPPTFNTFYDDYTDKVITPLEDEYLARDKRLLYMTLVDRNCYVPSHNSKFSRPLTGNPENDNHYHRSKRIFNDMAGLLASRNTRPFLLQNYPRDTGEMVADISVPVFVFGRHWGVMRGGYKRGK